MADDPKSKSPAPSTPPAEGAAPGDAKTPGAPGAPAEKPNIGNITADPLSDGTTPTILTPGESHKSVPKSKASLNTVYRRADIMTTLLTFAGTVVAAAIIFAGYYFFTRNQTKPNTTPPGKVTNLSSSDLSKLGAFFNGNSAGSSAQILTISSSSLFNNRVAVNSDLKVTGALSVTSPTALGALTVDQQSTLGVTDIRAALTVSGPANFQSPVSMVAGANVKGDLATSGNGSFGGSISAGVVNAATISVTTINLAGHLSITGAAPSASATGAGTNASVSSSSNDTAGTITVDTGSVIKYGNSLVTLKFHTDYPRDPTVIITPIGAASAALQPYVEPGASSFTIGVGADSATSSAAIPSVGTSFAFNYWVVQ